MASHGEFSLGTAAILLLGAVAAMALATAIALGGANRHGSNRAPPIAPESAALPPRSDAAPPSSATKPAHAGLPATHAEYLLDVSESDPSPEAP